MKQLRALVPARLATSLTSLIEEAGALAVDTSAEPDLQGRVWITAYCEEASAPALRRRCQLGLDELAQRWSVEPTPNFESQDVRADWETSWTQVLPPARLTPGLVLIADGVAFQPAAGERVVRLEPGLFFGFGEHPTTQLISEWISEHCANKRVLDVGCGTGVLAFVAAFAGARSVLGIDIDAPSVESAQRNAVRNGWQDACTFSMDALERVSTEFDVVLANIDAKTLTLVARDLCRVLAPGGRVALTGVLEEQAASVRHALASSGVTVEVGSRRQGWVLLANTPAAS